MPPDRLQQRDDPVPPRDRGNPHHLRQLPRHCPMDRRQVRSHHDRLPVGGVAHRAPAPVQRLPRQQQLQPDQHRLRRPATWPTSTAPPARITPRPDSRSSANSATTPSCGRLDVQPQQHAVPADRLAHRPAGGSAATATSTTTTRRCRRPALAATRPTTTPPPIPDMPAQPQFFPTTCQTCHTTTSWLNATFNHKQYTQFPINHGNANGVCSTCHTNSNDYSVFQCTNCHLKNQTDGNHQGIRNYVYNSINCYQCHRTAVADRQESSPNRMRYHTGGRRSAIR